MTQNHNSRNSRDGFDFLGGEFYNRTYGFGLSGLGAAFGSRIGTTTTTRALAAGAGAALGGLLGDYTHTKLPISTIIATSALTGASAAAITLAAKPAINWAVDQSIDYIRHTKHIKALGGLDYILKLKSTNKLFDRFVSKAGLTGLVLGLTVPMVHKHVQSSLAIKTRNAQTQFASIRNTFTPSQDETNGKHAEEHVSKQIHQGNLKMKVQTR